MDDSLRESVVLEALQHLMQEHGHDCPHIDDIVLGYVCSLLADLNSEDSSDLFDPEAFAETLAAYLPEAEHIESQGLKQWIFKLAEDIARKEGQLKRGASGNLNLKEVIEATAVCKQASSPSCSSSGKVSAVDVAANLDKPQDKRVNRLSETSDGGSEGSYEGDDWSQLIEPLLEMFPYSCTIEVNHCLQLTAGDVERTAQLIMHRHETGQNLKPTDRKLVRVPKTETDEKTLKQAIIGKYGYVDKEDDQRYHRPIIRKIDDKKLIRYRDGKIVSTKGERFTQVSKQESEEMKKTIKI